MGYDKTKPHRYNIDTDQMVNVTQEWVDDVQKMFSRLGAARGHARSFLKSENANPEGTRKAIQAFMDAWKPEFADNLEPVSDAPDNSLMDPSTIGFPD